MLGIGSLLDSAAKLGKEFIDELGSEVQEARGDSAETAPSPEKQEEVAEEVESTRKTNLHEQLEATSKDDDVGWDTEDSPERLVRGIGGIGSWIGSRAKEFMNELGSEVQEIRKGQDDGKKKDAVGGDDTDEATEALSHQQPNLREQLVATSEEDEIGWDKDDLEVPADLEEALARLDPETAAEEGTATTATADKVLELQKECSALQQIQAELRTQLESARGSLSESVESLRCAMSEKDELKREVQAIQKELADEQAAHSQSRSELRNASDAASAEAEASQAAALSQVAELKSKVEAAEQELAAERAALNAAREELTKQSGDDIPGQLVEAERQRQVAESASAEAQESLRAALSEIDELRQSVQAKQQELQQQVVEAVSAESKESLSAALAEIDELKQQVQATKQDLIDEQTAHSQTQSALRTAADAASAEADASHREAEAKLSELEARAVAAEQQLEAERAAHSAAREELTRHKEDDLRGQFAEAEQQRQEAECASSEAKESLRAALLEIEELKQQVQATHAEQAAHIQATLEIRTASETASAEAASSHAEENAKFAELEARLVAKQQELDAERAAHSAARADLAKHGPGAVEGARAFAISSWSSSPEIGQDAEDVQPDIASELEQCWSKTDAGLDRLLAQLLQVKAHIRESSKPLSDG